MTKVSQASSHPASFRDRDGFLFERNGQLLRQVNRSYAPHYDLLMESGLYDQLAEAGDLVRHRELEAPGMAPELAYKVIQPDPLEFVSYPYEWCFSQLKDAAMLTLKTQKRALESGLTLKDASAYNVQFHASRPLLIDSLSFSRFEPGEPWIAYRQFCQHFLAPLALMAYRDVRLGQLLRVHLDGVPLGLTSRLLPLRTRLRGGLQIHIHLHASMQRRASGSPTTGHGSGVSRRGMLGLIDSLERAIRALDWEPAGTEWSDYVEVHAYSPAAFEAKRRAVEAFLDEAEPRSVWDLGANTGVFSRLSSSRRTPTIAFDLDPGAVELNYRQCRTEVEPHLLPLLLDLTNPSPSQGWAHRERDSLVRRGPAGAMLALALVHHLAIGNNLPLSSVAEYLAELGPRLLIEYVPKGDPQVQRMLANRADIFDDYSAEGFESAFQRRFGIVRRTPLADSERALYWLDRLE